MLTLLRNVRWQDFLDITLVAVLIWLAFVWLRRTRSRFALTGVAMLALVFLLARELQLQLVSWILQGFFAVLVVVLVVVFQDDLRRLFEQIALWGLRRHPPATSAGTAEILMRAMARLAHSRIGALLVIPGREPLDRHLEGGIALDALISEPLLISLFDPTSPGHDGAVILQARRLSRFSVHLPLSSDHSQLRELGTRHAAALGLAERTDALCIVVSEERGTVSVALAGRLRRLPNAQALEAEVQRFLDAQTPAAAQRPPLWRVILKRWPEALAAWALAASLWWLLVPGSDLVEVVQQAPVVIENLPPGYVLDLVEPAQVTVTLEVPRRQTLVSDLGATRVRVDALLVQLGRRTFQLSADQVERPSSAQVLELEPRRVRLSVHQQGDLQR